jgi:P27 family predicted phage terminase small subunit
MTGRLDPPAWYDHERRTLWDDTITRLTDAGGLFRADPKIVDTYVCAYANHTQAARIVAQTTVLITTKDGRTVENPALAVQRRTAADLARASKALGLDRTPMQPSQQTTPMQGTLPDGRRWCAEHEREECKHPRKDGTPCHGHYLIPGTGSCRMHVGMSAAAAREVGAVVLARLYGDPDDEATPSSALLDEVRWSAGHVAALRAKVGELAEADGPDGEPGSALWWGTVRELWKDGELAEREMRAGPHVILKAYDAERHHLVVTAAAAHTAGAQDDAVNVARALGAGVRQFLDRLFTAVRLEPWQWELVPQVVPALLAEFDPEAEAGAAVGAALTGPGGAAGG